MLTALAIATAVSGFRPADAEECRVYAAATGGRGGYNIASRLDDLPGGDLIPPENGRPLRTDGPALALWPCGLPMGEPPLSRPEGERGFISRPVFNRRHDRAFVLMSAGCGVVMIDVARDQRGRWKARPSNQGAAVFCEPDLPRPPLPPTLLTPPPIVPQT